MRLPFNNHLKTAGSYDLASNPSTPLQWPTTVTQAFLQRRKRKYLSLNSTGLLSNQGEKRCKLLFHKGSFKTKVLKYGTPKPSLNI